MPLRYPRVAVHGRFGLVPGLVPLFGLMAASMKQQCHWVPLVYHSNDDICIETSIRLFLCNTTRSSTHIFACTCTSHHVRTHRPRHCHMVNPLCGGFFLVYILKKAGEENTIWKIDLGFNKIGDDGVIAIAKLLESGFSKVEWLNLHGNDAIGFEGMKALSRAVAQDQVLGSIDLGNNVRMTTCNAVHGSIRYNIYNM